jgi:hypothetical protein
MAIVEREKYTAQKINKLRDFLQRNTDIGKPIEYEILVDGLKAVLRTDNPEHFETYELLVDGDSKYMEIIFYKGGSNHNEKRIYSFREENNKEGLSGIDIEAKIEERLLKAKQETTLENLQTENSQLKERVEDLENEIEELETNVGTMQAKLSPLNGMLGDFGSNLLESFIKRNPQLLTALPGGQALAGLIGTEDPKTEALNGTPETEVSFKAKEPDAPGAAELSEEDKSSIKFTKQLTERFNKEQFNKIIMVLQSFAKEDKLIDEVLTFLSKEDEPVKEAAAA